MHICICAPRTGVLRGETRARVPARRSYVVLVNWTLLQICVAVLLNRRAGGARRPRGCPRGACLGSAEQNENLPRRSVARIHAA